MKKTTLTNNKGGHDMAKVLATKEFTGPEAIQELKASLKNVKAQGLRVPAITFRGQGTFQGFDVEVADDKNVVAPIGHKLLRVVTEEGRAAKPIKPNPDAVITMYSVAEGEPLKDSDPLANFDLFTPADEAEATDPEDE